MRLRRAIAPRKEVAPATTILRQFDEGAWVEKMVIDGVGFKTPILRIVLSDNDGDGFWVVSDHFSSVFGSGESPHEAVDDYVTSLVEQYNWLDSCRDELSHDLIRELSELDQRLARVAVR